MPFADPADRADYYRRVEKHRNGGHLPTVLAHVRLLRESGMSLNRIAEVSGVSYLAMRGLWQATSTRVTRSVADRVLAVQPGDLSDGAFTDRARADELFDRLVARGWTPATIGTAFGYQDGVEFRVQRPKVKMGTVRRLRALLDEDPPGTSLAEALDAEAEADAYRARNLAYQHKSRQNRGSTVAALQPRKALREEWRDAAKCRTLGPDVFFPSEGVGNERARRRAEERAKAVCALCPVQAECLEYAMETGQYEGVWGGQIIRRRQTA